MTLVARHSALSDIGLRRKTNEDTFVVAPPLFAVCDGMGGAQAGEVASRLAAEALVAGVASGSTLRAAAEQANAAVFAHADDDEAYAGMGTTLTAALLEEDTGHFVHIGDSRAYLLRDGELTQVSDDHSLVAEMVRDGRLTEEEAAAHPHRSVLSRALGTDESADLDEFAVDLRSGDVLLLCSDGLSGPVTDRAVAEALGLEDPDEAVATLIAEARRHGGPDNITAVVLRFEEGPAAGEAGAAPRDEAAEGPAEDGRDSDSRPAVDADESGAAAAPAQSSTESVGDAGKTGARRLGCLAGLLALLVVAGLVGVVVLSSVFYVSVDEDRLTLYSGVPVDVGPVPLHVVYRSSSRTYTSLTEAQREFVDERDLRSKDAALDLARDLEMWQ